jgi:hypothetical protein
MAVHQMLQFRKELRQIPIRIHEFSSLSLGC